MASCWMYGIRCTLYALCCVYHKQVSAEQKKKTENKVKVRTNTIFFYNWYRKCLGVLLLFYWWIRGIIRLESDLVVVYKTDIYKGLSDIVSRTAATVLTSLTINCSSQLNNLKWNLSNISSINSLWRWWWQMIYWQRYRPLYNISVVRSWWRSYYQWSVGIYFFMVLCINENLDWVRWNTFVCAVVRVWKKKYDVVARIK